MDVEKVGMAYVDRFFKFWLERGSQTQTLAR